MKNLTPILLGSLLALGAVACDNNARTSTSAPDTTSASPSGLTTPESQTSQDDSTSELRRRQLNSDVRAREQRGDAVGGKTDGDLASQVRSKLEANLPSSALTVAANDGAVTVTGTVVENSQLAKIEPLAKEISGVESVAVDVKVSANANPIPPSPGSSTPIKSNTNTN